MPPAAPVAVLDDLTSAVYDNGRRGEPLIGCDCMQCFGYCMIDAGERQRELAMSERIARESDEDRT